MLVSGATPSFLISFRRKRRHSVFTAVCSPGTPGQGAYALGWGVISHPWSREPFLQHAGSNTLNLAMVVVQPARDFAMVMATNIGGDRAQAALNALAEALYRQYGPARA